MLYYERIDVPEGSDVNVNKKGESKEFDICHYWHFLNKSLNRMSAMDAMIY